MKSCCTHQRVRSNSQHEEKKKIGKTTPFHVNLMRSQVLYWAAQEASMTGAVNVPAELQSWGGGGFPNCSHVQVGSHMATTNERSKFRRRFKTVY